MTSKSDFSEQEWDLIRGGPPRAALIVITAQRGGSFRETLAMAQSYAEARQRHGQSELLDEIVAARPEVDHTLYRTPEELKEHGLQHLRDAVELLKTKASPEEVDDYRHFVVGVAEKVAAAHREHGVAVSEAEQAAIDEIAATIGAQTGA